MIENIIDNNDYNKNQINSLNFKIGDKVRHRINYNTFDKKTIK